MHKSTPKEARSHKAQVLAGLPYALPITLRNSSRVRSIWAVKVGNFGMGI